MFGQTFQILILEMGKIALSGIYRFLPETLRHIHKKNFVSMAVGNYIV
jgi:hypothetical protein